MRLFKSALRKRIENKRNELIKNQLSLIEDRDKEKQTLNPARYSHYAVQIYDLRDKINLLTEILET